MSITLTVNVNSQDVTEIRNAARVLSNLAGYFESLVVHEWDVVSTHQPGEIILTDSNHKPIVPPPPPVPPIVVDDVPQNEVRVVDVHVTTSHEVVPIISNETASVELDTDGLPWDARIHAATKTKNADGRWKQRRGTDPALVESVRAELKAVMAIPAPVTDAVPSAPPVTDAVPSAPPVTDAVPSAPPVTDAVPPAPANFPEFIKAVGSMLANKLLKNSELEYVMMKHGISNVALVGSRPDLIPAIWQDLYNV